MPITPAPYPLLLNDLSARKVVIVGGGQVAERKVRALLAAAATPELISPSITAALQACVHKNQVQHFARPYQHGDLKGAFLAIIATNDTAANQQALQEAQAEGAIIIHAEDAQQGNAFTPATVSRGDLVLMVSTCGTNPSLTRHLKAELSDRYGAEYAALLTLLGPLRPHLQQVSANVRADFFKTFLTPEALGHLTLASEQDATALTATMQAWLTEHS